SLYRPTAHPDLPPFPTRRSSDLLGDTAQELLPQDLDVVAPVPQRREMDGDHVQPVVQVRTEAAALDVVLQVAVGRGHDPDVPVRSEEHTSELQSRGHLVCRLLLE